MTTLKQLVADHEEYMEGQRERAVASGAAFLIWSRRHDAWWRPDRMGYTTDRTEAGRYTETEARQIERQSAYNPEALRSVAVSEADAMAGVV